MSFASIPSNLRPHLQHDLLSAEEERSLLIKAQLEDRGARDRLHRFNLRLLVAEAKDFHERYPRIEFDELFDACFIALNKAIDEFDLSKNTRLSTYAGWKLLNEMQKVAAKVATQDKYSATQLVEELELGYDPCPLERLERQELLTNLRNKRREIWKALKNFPRQIRKLIIWRLLGHTFQSLGDLFGLSRQTARNRFNKYFPLFRRRLHSQAYCFVRTPQLSLRKAVVRPTRAIERQPTLLPLLTLVQTVAQHTLRVLSKVFHHRQPKPRVRQEHPQVFCGRQRLPKVWQQLQVFPLVAMLLSAFEVFCSFSTESVIEPSENCILPPKGVVCLDGPRPPNRKWPQLHFRIPERQHWRFLCT
jgi:RNA polymerase sigma factor (sigma-70 family)